MANQVIFEFNSNSDLSNWTVVNNGGFCSVKCDLNSIAVDKNKIICLRIKGDSKNYQFRVKTKKSDAHSYIYPFRTSGDWQNIEIPVTEFYPSFRGKQLNIPHYNGSNLEEIAFLIGNKKGENFSFVANLFRKNLFQTFLLNEQIDLSISFFHILRGFLHLVHLPRSFCRFQNT